MQGHCPCHSESTILASSPPASAEGTAQGSEQRTPYTGRCAWTFSASSHFLPLLLLPRLSEEPVESDLRRDHLLHLRQGGRLEKDPGSWALGAAPSIRNGKVDAGSGLDVPGAGVEDTGQRAKPWGSQTRVAGAEQDVSGEECREGGGVTRKGEPLAHPGHPSAGPPRGAASAPA